MIFLVVLSLGLVVSFRASVLQERMAGGFRNESLAEGSAESALRAGENWIWSYLLANGGAVPRAGERPFLRGPAAIDPAADLFRTTAGWLPDGEPYTDVTISTNIDGELAHRPRFQIEVIGAGSRDVGSGGAGGRTLVTHTGSGYAGGGGGGGSLGIVEYYRITARGAGGTEGVVRMVESTFTVTR